LAFCISVLRIRVRVVLHGPTLWIVILTLCLWPWWFFHDRYYLTYPTDFTDSLSV